MASALRFSISHTHGRNFRLEAEDQMPDRTYIFLSARTTHLQQGYCKLFAVSRFLGVWRGAAEVKVVRWECAVQLPIIAKLFALMIE